MPEQTQPIEPATEQEFLINEILLEGMMAGLFESCQIVKPSDLGYKTLQAFDEPLKEAANRRLVEAVFAAAGAERVSQEKFLLSFLRLIQGGKRPFKSLAAKLDQPDNVQSIKQIVRFLGIRFGTLFCLMGIRVEQFAASSSPQIIRHLGNEVELIPA